MRVKTAPNMEMVIYAFILYEIILSQFDKGIFYLINDDVMMNDYSKNVNKLIFETIYHASLEKSNEISFVF